jgi:hypothetical protein
MMDPKVELRMAEKRTKVYFLSIFLFLGIALFAFLITRTAFLVSYSSYLRGVTVICGGVGLVDIGFYLGISGFVVGS